MIDRNCQEWNPTKSYDLFLGLGVGNTGRNFVQYANASGAPKKVLLALGTQPDIRNENALKRYNMFEERTGNYAPPMRTVTEVTGDNFVKITDALTHIFCIGEEGTKSHNSFSTCEKPVINFYPSVSPRVSFKEE